jgi:putative ABC transport system permease protein
MIRQDVRHMFRQMQRSPGFALVVILLLGLGIGATTAVFGLVRGVLLRPLPFGASRDLVVVWEDLVREGNHTYSVAPLNARDVRNRTDVFADAAFQVTGGGVTLTGAGPTEMIRPGVVTGNFFDVVQSRAALGRTLIPSDEATQARVVVLSDALWRARFGADAGVIGKPVTLDDERYTIVGVMPPDFESPWVFKAPHITASLWMPLNIPPDAEDRTSAILQVVGRLQPGMTVADAQSRLSGLSRDLARAYPVSNTDVGFNVVPMQDQITGRIRTPLLLLLGAIIFLLLIACANLASMLLQRTLGRRHELAVRVAVGASRRHIIRQLVTENTVLALIGGVAGSIIGLYGTRVLVALAPRDTPRLAGVRPDTDVMLFAAAATVCVAVALAFAPALRASADIGAILRASRSGRSDRMRSAFAFVQISLAVVLLIAGSLFIRSFGRLTSVDPGFDTHNLTSLRVGLPAAKYATADQQVRAFDALTADIESIPGVLAAGVTSRPPLDPPYGFTNVALIGAPARASDRDLVGYRIASIDYLAALGVPLRAGRLLNHSDAANASAVAVINDAMAKKYFPGKSALHARLAVGGDTVNGFEVVGIVGSVSNGTLDAAPMPEMFVPLAQNPIPAATLLVRTRRNALPAPIQQEVQQRIMAFDAGISTQESMTMDEIASNTVALPRFSAFLVTTFAVLALLLATIGVYGVFAQAVAARSREIGIRSALGATAHRLVIPVLAEGVLVTVAGILCGVFGALVLSRILQSQLFGITATDPGSFVLGGAAMLVIAIIACAAPARRAVRVNPASAMRAD